VGRAKDIIYSAICEHCGGEFSSRRKKCKEPNRYCSDECRYAGRSAKTRGTVIPKTGPCSAEMADRLVRLIQLKATERASKL